MDLNLDSIDWEAKIIEYGLGAVKCLLIIIIGFWIVRILSKLFVKAMNSRDIDAALVGFLQSIVSNGLKILVVVTAISMLGVKMTSFVAILGAAGLAIGLALSGTLQNFAGGILLLVLKPFTIGDAISAQGHLGKVKDIQIFVTTLLTPDNKTVLLPNGPLANGDITNFSTEAIRRVDMSMGISYNADIDHARKVLMEIMQNHPQILKEPVPFVVVTGHGASSIDLSVRAFCEQAEYWNVNFDVLEKAKKAFDREKIEIPFPQMVVHMEKETAQTDV